MAHPHPRRARETAGGCVRRAGCAEGGLRRRLRRGRDRGTHYITIRGKTGSIRIALESVPAPDNPKTALLACFSALAAIKAFGSNVRYGT
jgi:hypothetical protein